MSTVLSPTSPQTTRAPGFTRQQFDAFLNSLNEPSWLTQRRREAFGIYEEKLAEPLNPEEYKRVDLRAFQPGRFAVSDRAAAPAQFETLLEKKAEFAGAVSHFDGQCTAARLDEKLASQGCCLARWRSW